MWSKFYLVVIAPKCGKTAKIFGVLGVMAKTLYGYWSGHPCLVGVVGPNVARVSIIEAEKCIYTNGYYMQVMIKLPSSHFYRVAEMMLKDVIYSESQVFG